MNPSTAPAPSPKLFTVGEIALQVQAPVHRVQYVITERGIAVVQRAGRLRLFDGRGVEAVRSAIRQIDSRH
jgi:hypothetical protein